MSFQPVMPSNQLILCLPFSSSLQSFPASGCFQDSVLRIRWPKYRSFSFNISPSNEHSGLISFRMNWLDLLAVQGTLKSLSSTTVQKHQFFGAQLSLQAQLRRNGKDCRVHCCSATQSCPALLQPVDCSPPGSFIRGISQARILDRVAISFSRGFSQSRDQTHISCIGMQVLYH